VSATRTVGLSYQIGRDLAVRTAFAKKGRLDNSVDPDQPRAISDRWPVFAFAVDLESYVVRLCRPCFSIGHVREPAVSYLAAPLPPLWKSYFGSWQDMVGFFHADYSSAVARADAFDRRVDSDARKVGGDKYRGLCALALRQAYGGTELVSRNGEPWALLKEISSDGNVSTVDVIYPSAPPLPTPTPPTSGSCSDRYSSMRSTEAGQRISRA